MKGRAIALCFAVLVLAANVLSQGPAASYPPQEQSAVLNELTRISRSVQTLSERLKVFVDKLEDSRGTTLTDKQQKLLLGMNLLAAAEQRVAMFQKFQIELAEKLNESRGKLSQVEIDLRPRNIDRSVAFEGTTETEELRDNRRQKLGAERATLTQLIAQIQSNLAETTDNLREAQRVAFQLRRSYLPQIERELSPAP